MKRKYKKFIENWIFGTIVCFILLLILGLTGWRKWYADEPMKLQDLLYAFFQKPLILIGGVLFFGALIALAMEMYFSNSNNDVSDGSKGNNNL